MRNRKAALILLASCVTCFWAMFAIAAAHAGAEEETKIKWILPLEYYEGNDFVDGRAWVREKQDGPWALVDVAGKILKEGFDAYSIGKYRGGFAMFWQKNVLYGYLDLSGNVALASADGSVSDIAGEGLFIKKSENGLYGYVDMDEKWVIPPIYESVDNFGDGLGAARSGGKWGFIDRAGNVAIDFMFDRAIGWFKDGVCAIEKGSRLGLIDRIGNIVTEFEFDAYCFPGLGMNQNDSKGAEQWRPPDPIGLQKDGKIGYVDASGNVVIDFKYKGQTDASVKNTHGVIPYMYSFHNGRAVVATDEWEPAFAIIDRYGKEIFRPGKGSGLFVRQFKGGFISGMKDGDICLWDTNGRCYNLSRDLAPSVAVYPSGDNVFRAWDKKEHKTGYFVIEDN